MPKSISWKEKLWLQKSLFVSVTQSRENKSAKWPNTDKKGAYKSLFRTDFSFWKWPIYIVGTFCPTFPSRKQSFTHVFFRKKGKDFFLSSPSAKLHLTDFFFTSSSCGCFTRTTTKLQPTFSFEKKLRPDTLKMETLFSEMQLLFVKSPHLGKRCCHKDFWLADGWHRVIKYWFWMPRGCLNQLKNFPFGGNFVSICTITNISAIPKCKLAFKFWGYFCL